jgi:hypothetical protein
MALELDRGAETTTRRTLELAAPWVNRVDRTRTARRMVAVQKAAVKSEVKGPSSGARL